MFLQIPIPPLPTPIAPPAPLVVIDTSRVWEWANIEYLISGARTVTLLANLNYVFASFIMAATISAATMVFIRMVRNREDKV